MALFYARTGIIGAIMLGFGRALGETMAVTMVIGNNPQISTSLYAPQYTMAAVIANEFTEATGNIYLSALVEIGLVLFVMTLIINALSRTADLVDGATADVAVFCAPALRKARMMRDRWRRGAFAYRPHLLRRLASCSRSSRWPSSSSTSSRAASRRLNLDFFRRMPAPVGETRRRHGQRHRRFADRHRPRVRCSRFRLAC